MKSLHLKLNEEHLNKCKSVLLNTWLEFYDIESSFEKIPDDASEKAVMLYKRINKVAKLLKENAGKTLDALESEHKMVKSMKPNALRRAIPITKKIISTSVIIGSVFIPVVGPAISSAMAYASFIPDSIKAVGTIRM